jgi:hypothetical protein
MRFFLPLINIVIAAALFFLYTDQVLVNAPLNENVIGASGRADIAHSEGGIRALSARAAELNEAIDAAKAVSQRVGELGSIYNSFSAADLARLDELLPDHVDNIQLIIDVNRIAGKYNMAIKNVKIITADDGGSAGKMLLTAPDQKLGALVLSFSVLGNYDSFKKFMSDLASSLRIIDISAVSFGADDKGLYSYDIALKTYWLK